MSHSPPTTTVNDTDMAKPRLITIPISEQHGVCELCFCDWEHGARGEGDFWDLVEQEVERRLQEGSVDYSVQPEV